MHAREFANLVVPGKLSLPFTLSRDCNTIQTNSINKVPKQFQEMEQQEGKNVGIRLNTWVRLVNAYFPSYVYECNQDFLWDINTYISTVLRGGKRHASDWKLCCASHCVHFQAKIGGIKKW